MIGKKIKELREAKGMTQSELANKIGVNLISLINVEQGLANFGEDRIKKIASIFNIEQSQLFKIKKNVKTQYPGNCDIGKKIKHFRKLNNMTQTELAKLLGYASSGQICFIEKGQRGMSRSQLFKFCSLLKIEINEMSETVEKEPVFDAFMLLYHSSIKPEIYPIIENLIMIAASELSND